MKENFKNILIVRTDRIGDVVCTTPAIANIRKAYPQARITVLLTPVTVEILDGSTIVDRILLDDRRGINRGIGGFFKLVNQIRQEKFDAAFVFHTKKRSNWLCFLAGIPVRVGYKNEKAGFLLNRPIEDHRAEGKQHEVEYCLDVLKHMDIAIEQRSLSVAKLDKYDSWLNELMVKNKISNNSKLIALHPGASDSSKMWPKSKFIKIINHLYQKDDVQCVLIGDERIKSLAEDIASKVTHPVLDLTGSTSIGQTMSLLSRCKLLISNDSGPVHLSAAVNTPVISIFTRNSPGINPERWRPWDDHSIIISPKANDQISFSKAGSASADFLELIQIEEVSEAVDSFF